MFFQSIFNFGFSQEVIIGHHVKTIQEKALFSNPSKPEEESKTITQHNLISLRKDYREMHLFEILFERAGKEKQARISTCGRPQCLQFSSRISFTHQIPTRTKDIKDKCKNLGSFRASIKYTVLFSTLLS